MYTYRPTVPGRHSNSFGALATGTPWNWPHDRLFVRLPYSWPKSSSWSLASMTKFASVESKPETHDTGWFVCQSFNWNTDVINYPVVNATTNYILHLYFFFSIVSRCHEVAIRDLSQLTMLWQLGSPPHVWQASGWFMQATGPRPSPIWPAIYCISISETVAFAVIWSK